MFDLQIYQKTLLHLQYLYQLSSLQNRMSHALRSAVRRRRRRDAAPGRRVRSNKIECMFVSKCCLACQVHPNKHSQPFQTIGLQIRQHLGRIGTRRRSRTRTIESLGQPHPAAQLLTLRLRTNHQPTQSRTQKTHRGEPTTQMHWNMLCARALYASRASIVLCIATRSNTRSTRTYTLVYTQRDDRSKRTGCNTTC